ALAITAFPFILEYLCKTNPVYFLRPIGIKFMLDQYWFFVSAGVLFLAFYFQFPFKEEEAWHCSCGYDLSYMNKTSDKCPECGQDAKLEWSVTIGGYSRPTKKRLLWAIFLFMGSFFLLAVGLLIRFIHQVASV
ncbi:MAG: hypothetical protein P8N28_04675, partial [Phycisphaerales bacterium]|nr:hypothetical protein [Phycisphaerales bacterium]